MLNLNLEMVIFVERGKSENSKKETPEQIYLETNNTLNLHIMYSGWNQTWATLMRDKCSPYCAIPAPLE